MKKLFLLLAMAGIMVACGGNDEKKDEKGGAATVENKDEKGGAATVENKEKKGGAATVKNMATTLDKLAASLEDDTPDNFIKIYKEMDKAYENASEADKKAMVKARKDWANKNPEKFENIEKAINILMEEGLL
jgi:hypothetical protein